MKDQHPDGQRHHHIAWDEIKEMRKRPSIQRIILEAWNGYEDNLKKSGTSGNCINASWIIEHALKSFGMKAHSVACDVSYLNASLRSLIDAGVDEADWPDSAWSVGCRCEEDAPQGQFPGHVVVVSDGWLIDGQAMMFSRPDRDMLVDANVCRRVGPFGIGDSCSWATTHGVQATYAARPEFNPQFRAAPGYGADGAEGMNEAVRTALVARVGLAMARDDYAEVQSRIDVDSAVAVGRAHDMAKMTQALMQSRDEDHR